MALARYGKTRADLNGFSRAQACVYRAISRRKAVEMCDERPTSTQLTGMSMVRFAGASMVRCVSSRSRSSGITLVPASWSSGNIDEIAKDFADQAKVVNLNVDENSVTAGKYNIKGIPTLLLFHGGEIKSQIVGNTGKENIAKLIESQLQETAS